MGTQSFIPLPTLGVGYAAPVLAASPSDLASIPTLGPITEGGYLNGQTAFVSTIPNGNGPAVYCLQPAISVNPDNLFVIPTPDDPTRQWVYQQVQEQALFSYVTDEIDLTKPQTITLIPPISYISKVVLGNQFNFFPTQKDGTITTGPTAQAGTDAAMTNYFPSTVQTNLVAGAVNTLVNPNGILTTVSNLSLTANGLRIQITSGAVLGTATVFKARISGAMGIA